MHGTRDCAININAIDSSFSRCSDAEDWYHVMKCRCSEGNIDEHLTKLEIKLIKIKQHSEKHKQISKKMKNLLKSIRKCWE